MRQCMDADNMHRRLKKIIGQVQAIDRMIDEDIPCEDILAQINAAKSALHGCGKVVLEGHIQHCVRDGIQHGDADKTIESFTKAVERFSNMSWWKGKGSRRAAFFLDMPYPYGYNMSRRKAARQAAFSSYQVMLENRSTALVKLSMVLSASPCWMPSRTQCWI